MRPGAPVLTLVPLVLAACAPEAPCPVSSLKLVDAAEQIRPEDLNEFNAWLARVGRSASEPVCATLETSTHDDLYVERTDQGLRVELERRIYWSTDDTVPMLLGLCQQWLPAAKHLSSEVWTVDHPWLTAQTQVVRLMNRLQEDGHSPEQAAWVGWCTAGPVATAPLRELLDASCGADLWPEPLARLHEERWSRAPTYASADLRLLPSEVSGEGLLSLWPQEVVWGTDPAGGDARGLQVDGTFTPLADAVADIPGEARRVGYRGGLLVLETWGPGATGWVWGLEVATREVSLLSPEPLDLAPAVQVAEGLALPVRTYEPPLRYDLLPSGGRRLEHAVAQPPSHHVVVPGDSVHTWMHATGSIPSHPTDPWAHLDPPPEIAVERAGEAAHRFPGGSTFTASRGGDGAMWSWTLWGDHAVLARAVAGETPQVGVLCNLQEFPSILPALEGLAIVWSDGRVTTAELVPR